VTYWKIPLALAIALSGCGESSPPPTPDAPAPVQAERLRWAQCGRVAPVALREGTDAASLRVVVGEAIPTRVDVRRAASGWVCALGVVDAAASVPVVKSELAPIDWMPPQSRLGTGHEPPYGFEVFFLSYTAANDAIRTIADRVLHDSTRAERCREVADTILPVPPDDAQAEALITTHLAGSKRPVEHPDQVTALLHTRVCTDTWSDTRGPSEKVPETPPPAPAGPGDDK
jgi:hypothetical protein